jgi:hypothetical protein
MIMAIVTSFDWESDTFIHHERRNAYREAVAEIAQRAKEKLPECNSRVDKAVALVLAGDVELLADGKARVASQSSGTTEYVVCNGTCECKDFPRAPSGWCKHRIAAGIQKRAQALVQKKLSVSGQAEAPRQPAPTVPLPEAPASANVRVMLQGREVQLTLRDSDEGRLLERLEAVLRRFPVTDKPADDTKQCPKHGVPMRLNHGKNGSTWHSHKTADGWCQGR